MRNRVVRLSFRHKQRAKAGAVKVFTNVRLRDGSHPRQIHLGYLAAGNRIPLPRRALLEERLRFHWDRLFAHHEVEIDWADAEKKWLARDEAKVPVAIDRRSAREQLRLWRQKGPTVILPCYGGLAIEGDDDHGSFIWFYRHSPAWIAAPGPQLNHARLIRWWRQRELPRLLHCYFRYVGRKPNYHFTRNGFVTYAQINIEKGFPLSQYLRLHPPANARPAPQLSLAFQEEGIRGRLGAVTPHPRLPRKSGE
jgi:hypothetical protein